MLGWRNVSKMLFVRANQQLSDSPWVSGVIGDCDQAHRTSGAVRVFIKRHSYSVTLAGDISLISEQASAARADDTGTGAGFILPSPPKSGRRGSIVRVQVAGAQLVYRARRCSPYETQTQTAQECHVAVLCPTSVSSQKASLRAIFHLHCRSVRLERICIDVQQGVVV
jgi:hypothetical protein